MAPNASSLFSISRLIMVFESDQHTSATLTDLLAAQQLLSSCDFTPSEAKPSSAFQANYKTELCRNWESGSCEFGDKCTFAHGREELRRPAQKSLKYKTKKCKQFHSLGYCLYGLRCQFIHTQEPCGKEPPTAASSRKNSIDEQSEPRRLPIFLRLAEGASTYE